MKKPLLLAAASCVFAFVVIVGLWAQEQDSPQDSPKVKTNYYDLPGKKQVVLEHLLQTENAQTLTNKSLKVLRSYVKDVVLGEQTPVGGRLTTRYFWFVYNALPDFVDERERHHGYYRGQNKQSLAEKLKAYALYRLDRSPENLKRIFEWAKPHLKEVLPRSRYQRMGVERYVNGVNRAHRAITSIPNFRQKLSNFYARYYTEKGKMRVKENCHIKQSYDGGYGFSSHQLAERLSRALGMDRYSPLYGSHHLSFWLRRHHEGNMETVHEIITEISKMYD